MDQKQTPPAPTLEQVTDSAMTALAQGDLRTAGLKLSLLASHFKDKAEAPAQKILSALAAQDPVAAAQALSATMNQPLDRKLEKALVYGTPGLLSLLDDGNVRDNPATALETARLAAILTDGDAKAQAKTLHDVMTFAPLVARTEPLRAIEAFRLAATQATGAQAAEATSAWKTLVDKLAETDPSRAIRVSRTAASLAPEGSALAVAATMRMKP